MYNLCNCCTGRRCVLGLATGSTPMQIYSKLIRAHKKGLSFSHVTTFNLDEYYPMKAEALQSYHRFMQEHLFKHIDIDPENIHIPDGEIEESQIAQWAPQIWNSIDLFLEIILHKENVGTILSCQMVLCMENLHCSAPNLILWAEICIDRSTVQPL